MTAYDSLSKLERIEQKQAVKWNSNSMRMIARLDEEFEIKEQYDHLTIAMYKAKVDQISKLNISIQDSILQHQQQVTQLNQTITALQENNRFSEMYLQREQIKNKQFAEKISLLESQIEQQLRQQHYQHEQQHYHQQQQDVGWKSNTGNSKVNISLESLKEDTEDNIQNSSELPIEPENKSMQGILQCNQIQYTQLNIKEDLLTLQHKPSCFNTNNSNNNSKCCDCCLKEKSMIGSFILDKGLDASIEQTIAQQNNTNNNLAEIHNEIISSHQELVEDQNEDIENKDNKNNQVELGNINNSKHNLSLCSNILMTYSSQEMQHTQREEINQQQCSCCTFSQQSGSHVFDQKILSNSIQQQPQIPIGAVKPQQQQQQQTNFHSAFSKQYGSLLSELILEDIHLNTEGMCGKGYKEYFSPDGNQRTPERLPKNQFINIVGSEKIKSNNLNNSCVERIESFNFRLKKKQELIERVSNSNNNKSLWYNKPMDKQHSFSEPNENHGYVPNKSQEDHKNIINQNNTNASSSNTSNNNCNLYHLSYTQTDIQTRQKSNSAVQNRDYYPEESNLQKDQIYKAIVSKFQSDHTYEKAVTKKLQQVNELADLEEKRSFSDQTTNHNQSTQSQYNLNNQNINDPSSSNQCSSSETKERKLKQKGIDESTSMTDLARSIIGSVNNSELTRTIHSGLLHLTNP